MGIGVIVFLSQYNGTFHSPLIVSFPMFSHAAFSNPVRKLFCVIYAHTYAIIFPEFVPEKKPNVTHNTHKQGIMRHKLNNRSLSLAKGCCINQKYFPGG